MCQMVVTEPYSWPDKIRPQSQATSLYDLLQYNPLCCTLSSHNLGMIL